MRNLLLSALALAALMVFASCGKDSLSRQEAQNHNGEFEVTIKGEMGEFAPSTRSTAESCIRMKWEAGDVIWAYDKNGGSLGKLTVSIEEGDYIAIMTGSLSSLPSDGKLFLVHSSLMDKTTQPTYSSGLTVDMSSQNAEVTPFVAYAVVEGVTATAQSNLKTKFSFATSVLKVNATRIVKGAALTSAAISDIETVCRLTISEGAFTVAGETSGTITKALDGAANLSRASFYVGVPSFSAGTLRTLMVTAGGKNYLGENVMQTAYAQNNYINYIYDVKALEYIDENSVSRGEGTYIASTGVVWAPVNCGYDATDHPYGKLYQWGRHDGCGYNDGSTYTEALIQENYPTEDTQVDGTTIIENENYFYWGSALYYDWLTTRDNTRWNCATGANGPDQMTQITPTKAVHDPCPAGWRVPTYYELNALYGSNEEGWATDISGRNGFYFNGTNSCTAATEGNKVFLPAAGYRDYYFGKTEGRGQGGGYWSSTSYHESVWNLIFNYKGLMGMYNGYRAEGYSVRCVQE